MLRRLPAAAGLLVAGEPLAEHPRREGPRVAVLQGEQDVLAMYEKRFEEALMRLKDLAEARENNDAYRKGLPTRERT